MRGRRGFDDGFRDGVPLVTSAQIGDAGAGLHLALGIVSALYQRERTGRGQKVECAMQDAVLNLCRVKLRDQQRLAGGPLDKYTQAGEAFRSATRFWRSGNDSGGGQPGRVLKCKGWETDPNAYIYFITQAAVWDAVCDVIGEPTWKTHRDYATLKARLPRLNQIFARIEQWTMTKTKLEAMEILNRHEIPCGPVLSMKELAEDRRSGQRARWSRSNTLVRGKYLTVGNPIKMSDSPSDVVRSPLLGEHTVEILRDVLGLREDEIEEIERSGAIGSGQVFNRTQPSSRGGYSRRRDPKHPRLDAGLLRFARNDVTRPLNRGALGQALALLRNASHIAFG